MPTIYVLKCEDDKYYVGKTDRNVGDRVAEHFSNHGCTWTKIHKPQSVVEVIEEAHPLDEDKYTKIYMERYGIDNVRGGTYSAVILPDYQKRCLYDEYSTAHDLCFNCKQKEHFATDCPLVAPHTKKMMTPIGCEVSRVIRTLKKAYAENRDHIVDVIVERITYYVKHSLPRLMTSGYLYRCKWVDGEARIRVCDASVNIKSKMLSNPKNSRINSFIIREDDLQEIEDLLQKEFEFNISLSLVPEQQGMSPFILMDNGLVDYDCVMIYMTIHAD